MKTVTIPTCANPFVVIINGKKYTYPAGKTVEVPDEVAEVIERHEEAKPKPEPPSTENAPSEGGNIGGNIGGRVHTRQEGNKYIVWLSLNDNKAVTCTATYDENGRLAMVDVDGTVYYMPD